VLTKGFLKPFLTIKAIGKVQFWVGIIFWIFSAFTFSIYFNYSRELFRSLTFILTPFILSPKEFMIYDLFFASLSVSLAFGFTIILWLTGRKNIKKQYYRMFAIGNAWLIIFIVLFILLRMASVINFGVQIGAGFDNPLDLIKDFWMILVSLPIFIFFYHWNYIRLMFRTKNWILISIFGYIFLTILIFKTTSIDKSILNNTYYSKNKDFLNNTEIRFNSYSNLYGANFADSTKEILINPTSDKTFNLLKNVKNAFNTDGLVSMDTIILEMIIIPSINIQNEIIKKYGSSNKDIIWPYATPEEIYSQIKRYEDNNNKELNFLINILNNMIFIFHASDINWEKRYKYSDNDIKRHQLKRIFTTRTTIQERLTKVVAKLRYDKDIEIYHHIISKMKIEK